MKEEIVTNFEERFIERKFIVTKFEENFIEQNKKIDELEERVSLHEKKNFCLTKICEKDRKDYFFFRFRTFPFHGNIIFSELSFK